MTRFIDTDNRNLTEVVAVLEARIEALEREIERLRAKVGATPREERG